MDSTLVAAVIAVVGTAMFGLIGFAVHLVVARLDRLDERMDDLEKSYSDAAKDWLVVGLRQEALENLHGLPTNVNTNPRHHHD